MMKTTLFLRHLAILLLLVIPTALPIWSTTLDGDVDGDGGVSIVDVTKLIDYLLTNNPAGLNLQNADVNRDGLVDIADVIKMVDYLMSGRWHNDSEKSPLSVSPAEIDFGIVALDTDKTRILTITNTGTDTLRCMVSSDSEFMSFFEVTVSGVEYSLAPGASMNCNVTCHGMATSGEARTNIIITSNDAYGNQIVKLHALGIDNESLVAESVINMQEGETKAINVKTDSYEIVTGDENIVIASRGSGYTDSQTGDPAYDSYYSSSRGCLVLDALSTGSTSVLVKDTKTDKISILTVYVEDVVPESHEYVDLQLPSGTLWATCNIGASCPEDYGDYFAWGETQTKEHYWGINYKWFNYGDQHHITKYCTQSSYGDNGFVDNKRELDPEDDAAYVNWGPSWRMPTTEQMRELDEYCSLQFTVRNGVYGLQLTSKRNGKSLFLPAAGHYFGTVESLGKSGYYWSRSLDYWFPHTAYEYTFHFSNHAHNSAEFDSRMTGQSVRPVYVSKN